MKHNHLKCIGKTQILILQMSARVRQRANEKSAMRRRCEIKSVQHIAIFLDNTNMHRVAQFIAIPWQQSDYTLCFVVYRQAEHLNIHGVSPFNAAFGMALHYILIYIA